MEEWCFQQTNFQRFELEFQSRNLDKDQLGSFQTKIVNESSMENYNYFSWSDETEELDTVVSQFQSSHQFAFADIDTSLWIKPITSSRDSGLVIHAIMQISINKFVVSNVTISLKKKKFNES